MELKSSVAEDKLYDVKRESGRPSECVFFNGMPRPSLCVLFVVFVVVVVPFFFLGTGCEGLVEKKNKKRTPLSLFWVWKGKRICLTVDVCHPKKERKKDYWFVF